MLLLTTLAVLAGIYAVTNRFHIALHCTAAGVVWAVIERQLSISISNLGTDSFQEASDFGFSEAWFWISTIFEGPTAERATDYLITSLAISIATILTLHLFGRLRSSLFRGRLTWLPLGLLCLAFLIVSTKLSDPINAMIEQSNAFTAVQDNFNSADPPRLDRNSAPLTILVYIGESTSALNMSLYGYPRETTPSLVQWRETDPNLIVFQNVFSTHTHTSPSLLEALSFQVIGGSPNLPITERKRVSLIDVAEKSGIHTVLYSNQGMSGTWNQASSIIFHRASKHFSINSRLFGNRDSRLKKPWDHEYLANAALEDSSFKDETVSLVFFHSYAGHGNYSTNIPPERRSAAGWFMAAKNGDTLGGSSTNLAKLNAYDAAIAYIDSNVATALSFVKKQTKPTILVYFSDHGDSVYTGRGHDSSRFVHEMARVPFLMYFNDSARQTRGAVFEKYRRLAKGENVSTLAQLSSTLLDIAGASFSQDDPGLVVPEPIGANGGDVSPILVRRIGNNISYIDLQNTAVFKASEINGADSATRHYILSHHFNKDLCYYKANSFAKALRGSFVTRCLEVDVVALPDGQIAIDPNAASSAGFLLDDLVSMPTLSSSTLWLNGENVESPMACRALVTTLERHRKKFRDAVVEFPNEAMSGELTDCIARLRRQGLRTSHSVSADAAKTCTKALSSGGSFEREPACLEVRRDLLAAMKSDLFSDISFDYSVSAAIKAIPESRHFRWNTLNFPEDKIGSSEAQEFGLVALRNDDPNTR